MPLIDLHNRLGNTAMLYTLIMAAWGLWRFFRRQGLDSSYWGALVIAEVLNVGQAILGAAVILGQGINPANPFMHILYGVVSVLVIPAVFLFTRGDDRRRSVLIYSLAFLFMVGILLRAQATGL